MEFQEKVAIVTGGGSGIGEQIALGFAREGAEVMIFDIDATGAQKVCSDIQKKGGKAISFAGDVTKEGDVQNMVNQTVKAFGSIHILINNAGVGGRELIEETTLERWRRVIDINLTGPFICCQAVLGAMKKQRSGKIVNMASTAGARIGFLGGSHYGASKAGLLNFTRLLAFEWAPYGINVNAVIPGATETPMWHEGKKQDAFGAEIRQRFIPLGRIAKPEQLADAVLFMCSDKASMITGTALPVDGGSLAGWLDIETYYKSHGKTLGD
ncbi:SDR family NAD(P)-dependent oxidoreductase [Chloroflexota bacterium]